MFVIARVSVRISVGVCDVEKMLRFFQLCGRIFSLVPFLLHFIPSQAYVCVYVCMVYMVVGRNGVGLPRFLPPSCDSRSPCREKARRNLFGECFHTNNVCSQSERQMFVAFGRELIVLFAQTVRLEEMNIFFFSEWKPSPSVN